MAVLPPNMQASLRSFFRGSTFPAAPTTLYLALFTAAPTGDAGGVEVSTVSTGYARQAITTGSGFAAVGTTDFTNTADIVFPAATAAWGTVVGWALIDQAASQRRLQGLFTAPAAVDTGKVFKVRAGELDASFAAC